VRSIVRWLIVLGWGIPLLVALAVLAADPLSGGAAVPARGLAVLLLVAPVLPLSLILLGLASIAGLRGRVGPWAAVGRWDRVFLAAAGIGLVLGLVLVAATVRAYVV